MVNRMPARLLVSATFVLFLATACGGSQVGGQGLFNGGNQTPGNFDFASPSSSAAAAIGSEGATAPPATSRPVAPPTSLIATPRPTPRPTATPQVSTFQIAIYGETSGSPGFQPASANVYQGTVIVFTNRDTQSRSVVSDPGDSVAFNSGLIAPGKTWSYTASTLGQFSYHDGTRPYRSASFTVIAR